MRLRRWASRCLIGRQDRRDRPLQSLMMRVAQHALTVDLKAAKALGITIPKSILVRADEVIR